MSPLPVMTSTKVRPSLWARCKKPDSARCARVCVIPCRSSRASISFRPRDKCERSRRPSGASGGAGGGIAGFGVRGILTDGTDGGDLGEASGFAATGASKSGEPAWGFAARCLLPSGLVCLATLSHNARSSSLRLRLRRGGASKSGINGGRFIGDGDNDDNENDGVGVPRLLAGSCDAPPATARFWRLQFARRLAKAAVARQRTVRRLRTGLLVFGLILRRIDLRKQLCDLL